MWRQRDIRGAKAFSMFALGSMFSSVILLLTVSLCNQAVAFFIYKNIHLFGECIAVPAFVVMVAQYSGNKFFRKPHVVACLVLLPFLSFIFAHTGKFFHYDYQVVAIGGWKILQFSEGPWQKFHQTYYLIISGIDLYMLIRSLYESKRQRFVSSLLLIFVSILPFIEAFVASIAGLGNIPLVNYNLYVWAFGGLVAMAALYMTRGQELIPIARDVVVENTNDMMLILNSQNKVVDFNKAAAGALGLNGKEIMGHPVVELLSGWGDVTIFIEEKTAGTIKQKINVANHAMTYRLSMTSIKDGSGENLGRLLVFHDVTEIEEREEIENRNRQLLALSQGVIAAQEEERDRLGRELHDDFGHKFLSLSMKIGALKIKCNLPEKDIGSIEDLVQDTADELMRIYKGLKPTIISRLGLSAALESLAREVSLQSGLVMTTSIDQVDKNDISFATALSIFRIAQESLTNIIKHAEAKNVRIEMRIDENAITLRIEDDGKGIESGSTVRNSGIGLIGMRERAVAIDGSIDIRSSNGAGTTVFLSVPLNQESSETKL